MADKSVQELIAEIAGVESESVQLLSEEVKAELEAKYSEFVAVQTTCGVSCHRTLTEQEYDRYQAMVFDDANRSKASKVAALLTLIYPDQKTYQTWLSRKPGIAGTCSMKVLELSGYQENAVSKKYGISAKS